MPKVYFLATVVTLVAAGLVLTGCPNQPVVPEIMPQFDATPVRGEIPLTVCFNDTTDPGDISVRAWHWDFGDGAKGTGPSPSHEYKVAGV
ncbi:MAG: PKD domain-containing protein, partial [Candidatus Hydrogenedentes bacterium]|nr:PKD domain-containing protein [Candidatus Hydrogenedentota bacterium]